MSSAASRLLVALLAACGLVCVPASLQAQRALVYCPVAIDATGCNTIVTALAADPSPFPAGVDSGFDGSGGTVDLATADLSGYAVLVVPSLADGAGVTPYALLRAPAVADRIKAVFVGRAAIWSGSPDAGSTNRVAKNGLLRNLAIFSRADSANNHGPGLVVLQDNSDDGAARYGWLAGISALAVSADTTFESYSNVDVLTPTGRGILTNGSGLQIGYTNMASLGLVPQGDASAVSQDARGGRSPRLVLLTTAGEPGAGIATITTDREDYQPGDTVTITGTGWEPGETVGMTLHEEPVVHGDRTLSAVADSVGHIFNNSFAPEEHDLGVRFVLTAVGQTSGRTAQTTFTDNRQITAATVAGGANVTVQVGQAITAGVTVNTTAGGGGGEAWASTSWRYATTSPGGSFTTPCANTPDHAAVGTFTETFATSAPELPGTYNAYFLAWRTAGCGNNPSNLFILTSAVTVTKGSSSTSLASSANPSTFGQSVTLTATVAAVAPASGDPSGTVTFKDGAATIGTGTLACATSCTATFALATLSVSGSPHSLTAVYAGDPSFNGSTSAPLAQTVGKANTITTVTSFSSPTVFGQSFTFTASMSGGGVGLPTGQVQFRVDGVDLGTPATLSGGNATSPTVSGLSVGGHSLTAVYLGDPDFNGSLSGPFTHTVNKAGTTTAIATDTPDPSSLGQAVTVSFTVTPVSPGSGAPAGNVTVTASGGAESCIGTVATGSCAITLTVSGPRTLTAAYAGNGSFNPSTSAGAAHSVTAAATVLTVAPASGTFGGTAPLSATLTAGGSPVSGKTINFTLDGTGAGTATTNASGVAAIAAASLGTISAGSYPAGVGASFAGDASFGGSTGSAALTVNPAATTLDLTINTPSVAYGGSVSFQAKLTPTGAGRTVTFDVDGTVLGTAVTNPGGNASLTATLPPSVGPGPHTVTATFAGETDFNGSSDTGSLTVGPAPAAVALSDLSQSYDGTPRAVTVTTTPTGLAVSVTYAGSATPPTNAGSYAVVATVTDPNYTGSASGSLVVTPGQVTGHFTASPKVYDGTTSAAIATRSLTGVLGGDVVMLTGGTATFADKQVGIGKTVTATGFTLGGADAGNYQLLSTTLTAAADITPRTLAVTATGQDRIYDGTTAAGVTLADDRIPGDALTVSFASATFADKDAGNNKTITVSGLSLGGADAGNYDLASTISTTTATIGQAPVAPHVMVSDKTYDGTTAAAITARSLTGVLGADAVTLTGGTALFADKHVGGGKPVSASGFALAGGDAGNYLLSPATAAATASITTRSLAVTATGVDKVYDATAAATVTLDDDRVPGDALTLSYASALFADKHAGTGKPITVTGIAIAGGADQANYLLDNTGATATADIGRASLTPHLTASPKVYDGTTAATIATRTLSGILASDVVTLIGGTASFADKNVGDGKTVTGSGFTLAGADAGNYELDPATATTIADITPRTLVVTASAQPKVYDATTSATVALQDDRVPGDAVILGHAPATFADKNVGVGKTVTVTSINIGGGDAGNYVLGNTTATATADITPADLAPHFTAAPKVYDGNTAATIVTRSVTVVLGGDDVTLVGGTASFADGNAGTGKTVTGSGFTLGGGDGGNYVLNPATATTTADITPRPITVAANPGQSKVYGSPDPVFAYQLTVGTLVGGDGFTGALTRTPGETVTGSPYAISQGTLTAGPNYDITFTGTGFGITRATLTVVAADVSKVYGDAVPELTGTIMGVQFSDNITAAYTAYIATGGLALVTATTPVTGSPYPIIPAVSGAPSAVLDNYTIVPTNGNLTILEALPGFTGLVVPNVVFGQGSGTVSGTLRYAGSGQTVFPAGSVTVTVNGQSGTGTIQANGAFTATVNTSTLLPSGAGHPVALAYNGSDPNFEPASGVEVMKVLYNTAAGHQFLQPINPNLTTGNRSSFKIGSTIPTKFQLFKADGTTVVTSAIATIAVVKLDSNAETPVNEDLITTPADNGITFRVSSSQYIYNLGTKGWTAGTYRIIANLDDGSQITAEVDGRSK